MSAEQGILIASLPATHKFCTVSYRPLIHWGGGGVLIVRWVGLSCMISIVYGVTHSR